MSGLPTGQRTDPRYQPLADAMRRGDAMAARALLAAIPSPSPMVVAQVCRMANDRAGEEAALNQMLAANPRDLAALLWMGQLKQATGDERGASLWFRTALNQAAVTPPPPALQPLLRHAAQQVDGASARFEAHLAEALGDAGGLPRVAHAVALLTGRAELYLQQPSLFYFPGLPQRSFYEREEFAFVAGVEALVPAMQAELAARLAGGEDFRPYVETRPGQPAPNNPLRDDVSWGAQYFLLNGEPVPEHAAAAPATMAALALAPLPRIPGRAPMALWSLLKPGTHIQPHHGLLNTRLICHVPLITNPECALRVGADVRGWDEGRMRIFDDSIEHEAWNRGATTRVILLFEIWRPEISAEERESLTRLFQAIDSFGGIAAAESGGAL